MGAATRHCPPISILIVEDEVLVAISTRMALGDLGVNAVCATNGGEAQAYLAASAFTAVIIDVGLPDMTGTDLVRHLRVNQPALPVVLCTGFDAVKYATEFQDDANVRVIEKPYDEPYLFEQLKQLGVPL